MTWPHALESTRLSSDELLVTSDYAGGKRTTQIRRHELEGLAWELARDDSRHVAIIHGVWLDESDVLSLLADLGDPT